MPTTRRRRSVRARRPAALVACASLLATVCARTRAASAQATSPGAAQPPVVGLPAQSVSAFEEPTLRGSPVVALAAHHLAGLFPGVALAARVALPVTSGTVVRFVQVHQGVVVRDGGAAVLVARDGLRVLAVSDFVARALPAVHAAPVALTVAQAAARARAHVGGADPGDDAARTALVFTRELGAPRLVYECNLAPRAPGWPDSPRVLVDAGTGEVVLRGNRSLTHTGLVYPANPTATPTRMSVELPSLADDATELRGADIDAWGCRDERRLTLAAGTRLHLCVPVRVAQPTAERLWSFGVESPSAVDDAYAELSIYHHAASQVAFMRTLGLVNLRSQPMRATANVRFPWRDPANPTGREADPEGPLYPWNNAAFVRSSPPNVLAAAYGGGGDALVFGQGEEVDYAWDGDVVAHEIGHAVVATTADFGDEKLDRWGTDVAPRALNEALADYFSCARAGDPHVGEYAGGASWAGGAIRDLTAPGAHYPESLTGEEHNDSVPFSAALWAARRVAGAPLDGVVYEALAMAPRDPSNAALAAQVLAAAERVLGAEGAAAVRAALMDRGVLTEQPRVQPGTGRGAPRNIRLPAVTTRTSRFDYVPGYVQYRVMVPAGSTAMTLELPVFAAEQPSVRFLVRVGMPVEFEYGTFITSNADRESEPNTPGARIRARFEFGGESGLQADASTPLYIALGVSQRARTYAGALGVAFSRPPFPVDAGVRPAPSDAGAPDARTPDAGPPPPVALGGGCAARPGALPRDHRPVLAALLALAALAAPRRARRR